MSNPSQRFLKKKNGLILFSLPKDQWESHILHGCKLHQCKTLATFKENKLFLLIK